MFEDINHSGDGGIYADALNRNFLDNPAVPSDWSIVTSGRAAGSIKLDTSWPINLKALTTSMRLTISRAAHGERAGVASGGYYGIPVWPGTTYRASVSCGLASCWRPPQAYRCNVYSSCRLALR